MSAFRKLFTAGLGAFGGAAAVYYYGADQKGIVHASYTVTAEPLPITKWNSNWDRRDPGHTLKPSKGGEDDNRFNRELEEKKPKVTRHLFLIRHGQYNMEGKNDSERVLTELGRKQATLTGERLVSLKIPFQLMVRSTMARAQETGDYILTRFEPGSLAIQNDNMLEEGAPYPPEPPIGHWKPETYFFQDGSRIEAAFRNYFHRADYRQKEDSYEIIVCHANVIRYFVCRALQLPPEAWLRFSLNHGSITWLSIHPAGRVTLRTLGDAGHLPPDHLTTS